MELTYVSRPEPQTEEPIDLIRYLLDEIRQIEEALSGEYNELRLVELNVAPSRPRTGMIVLADGTNWNPGAGAGFYGYRAGVWNKLG